MLIDTHAHVNFIAFKGDYDEVIKRALENQTWLINIGSQFSTSQRAVKFANEYPEGVYAAVGLHPVHLAESDYCDPEREIKFATRSEELDYAQYKDLAQNPKVVAIGETGLDYFHLTNNKQLARLPMPDGVASGGQATNNLENIKKLQKKVFLQQLDLAREVNKPVIIHCREAHDDLIEILKSYFLIYNSNLRGVVHCFSGSWPQAEKYLEMGLYLSFTGVITYSESYNKVIINTPIEKILVETDCPYLAPIPFRGSRNEPLYVEYIARKIAELKNLSFEEVAKITTQNALDLFGLEW